MAQCVVAPVILLLLLSLLLLLPLLLLCKIRYLIIAVIQYFRFSGIILKSESKMITNI